MTIPLEKIRNQFALFQNNYLNFYNISFTDESLDAFLKEVEKVSLLKTMVKTIGISSGQQIDEGHKDMLKIVFTNWTGVFKIED
jgi:hypothetical protein